MFVEHLCMYMMSFIIDDISVIKTLKNTEEYDEWIECVEDRPFNDQRYYICAKKLKELGWSQKRTREDLIKYIQD